MRRCCLVAPIAAALLVAMGCGGPGPGGGPLAPDSQSVLALDLAMTRPVGPGPGRTPTVGRLFVLWGRPLSPTRLAGFAGRVLAFVGGRRWTGDPRALPLSRHAQIVLELGPRIPPHAAYLFPGGL